MAVLADDEVIKRVESPMNLFNRLRSTTKKENLIVSIPPKSEELIPDLDEKLVTSSSRTRALSVMNKVIGRLDNEINGIRVDRLPGLASSMANVIKSLEPERDKDQPQVQFVIYQPQMLKEADFGEIIEVKE